MAENVFVDIAILLATAMVTAPLFWISALRLLKSAMASLHRSTTHAPGDWDADLNWHRIMFSTQGVRLLGNVKIESETDQTDQGCVISTMLAIHDSRSGFHPHWVDYCRKNGIPYKVVDCHASNIVEQVKDCRALLWHHSHSNPPDILVARQILCALEHAGLTVFPDYRTAWHFDDKVGQKYLLETLDAPRLQTYVFVERKTALEWASTTDYPKVFKLRHGAGSSCVWLVHNERQARRLIRLAFGRGLPVYSPWDNLKERIYKWRLGKSNILNVAKGVGRFFYPPRFSKVLGRQTGYVLFQDFAPDNDSDIRITVIGDKAYGVRRWVRPGDFRASGSGRDAPSPQSVDIDAIGIAFRLAKKLGSSCLSCDFVYKPDRSLAVVEISYGFVWVDDCPGFWDTDLNWHPADYRPEHWMVDLVLSELDRKEVRADYRSFF